ncbi:response regulator [Planctomicrobium sp. SH661]|uniref:response regulator n=1 Tax=Planctomicrobium sp. SH661 TaxID=3448124 RepID=UPI003F5B6284
MLFPFEQDDVQDAKQTIGTGSRIVVTRRADARLLIADDDVKFRQTVVEILSPYFDVIEVPSGEQAIHVVETTMVDLALFDMNMDLLTGLDAIRWVREHQLEIPCILMSSDITLEIETEARELDAFSVIRKPPRRSQLLDTIHCALEI